MQKMKSIAFFDFDGTLTTRDTLIDFTRYAFGNIRFISGLISLSPLFFLHLLRKLDRDTVALRFIRFFYEKQDMNKLESIAAEYARKRLPGLLRADTCRRFLSHLEAGDTVAVVSASPSIWLKPWCDNHHVSLIATQLQADGAVLTGAVLGRRCNGPEKVVRIRQEYDLEQFEKIFAYGNSNGDVDMLRLADEAYYAGSTLRHY
ncbi:MAG: HAD-IB family hydrolase [Pseudomonadota bacterium]